MRKKQRKPKAGNIVAFLRSLADGDATYIQVRSHHVEFETRNGSISISTKNLVELGNADLVARRESQISLTEAGRAHLARLMAESDPFLMQHEGLTTRAKIQNDHIDAVLIDDAESPLTWLAKRSGPSGKPLIDAVQFQAGERLRADFTRAGLTPRVTSNWVAPIAQGKRAGATTPASFSDTVLAAKERLNNTLEAVGPEFAGVLLDVCCFLKGLETIERERNWPQRTAKVVLGLGLDRLARYYGIRSEIRGPSRSPTRYWRAPDARPVMNG